MKQEDVLTGIATRAAAVHALEPVSLRLSLLQRGRFAFSVVSSNLREEFPFLWNGREEMADCEIEQVDRLFRWFVKQIIEFPEVSERPEAELAKLLAVAEMLDCDDRLWDEVYQIAPSVSGRLLATMANLIKECHLNAEEILTRGRLSAGHVQAILADIASGNWKSLEWVLGPLWMDYRAPIKLQAAAALYRYDSSLLQSVLEDVHEFFEVASFTHHLPAKSSLRFALESKNWTFKFWAFHHSVRHAMQDAEVHSTEWEMLLTEASNNPTEWSRWLAVLNEHPSRYPQIQCALGNALARASGKALDTYIKSISAHTSAAAREPIAVALTAFRRKAASRERKRVWRAAFERWEQWDFGCTEQSESLFRVASSAFDFPVIGYLTECLDAEGRDNLVAQLEVRAAALQRTWHADKTFAITERFKLISAFQLLARAKAVSAGETDWLPGASLVKPPWEDGSLYRSLTYDNYLSKSTFLDS